MISGNLRHVADYIVENGKKSCRKLGKICNTSKSSINRHLKKIRTREHISGAAFFETAQGQEWILRLVVAAIFVFGISAGVGSEKIALFFSIICISSFAALSTSSIKRLENKIDDAIGLYQEKHDKRIKDKAADISITPGGDETFFENLMILVCMDLNSGFIFHETISEKRDHKTWESTSTPWLSRFKTVRCFLSDKAKALLKLAKTSLDVDRIPDLFHMMNDISKVMRFSFYRLKQSTEKLLAAAEKELAKGKDHTVNNRVIATLSLKLTLLSRRKIEYQKNLRQLSITLHPFEILSSKRQDSSSVSNKMTSSLSRIKLIQEELEISDPSKRLQRVERQIPDAAKQIDMWWKWVNCSLESVDISDRFKDWLLNYLLPTIYWKSRLNKTRSKKIKRFYERSELAAKRKLNNHSLTGIILQNNKKSSEWQTWAQQMVKLFIRATSAIEGRNSWLSQIHFNGRGLSQKRLKSQCAIHNYFLQRSDGSTSCERLSGIKPDNMFEFIVQNIGVLAEPRKRKVKDVRNPLNLQTVPG